MDNSGSTFLPADPVTLSLIGRAYELRDVKFRFPESSSASNRSDVQASSGNIDVQPENSTTVNSGRHFEVVASFQLIWWNQDSSSRNKLSMWRPVVPPGMVYFGDIAVKGYVLKLCSLKDLCLVMWCLMFLKRTFQLKIYQNDVFFSRLFFNFDKHITPNKATV